LVVFDGFVPGAPKETPMKLVERLSTRGQRHSLLSWSLICLGLFAAKDALAAEYYVSPTGSDSNPGTQASPWGTVQKAASTAAAGDTVYFRAGTYAITTPSGSNGIEFSKSGTSDTNRIKYWAYPGEVPVIDFTKMKVSSSGYTMGMHVTGSYLHFKGLEEKGVPMINDSNNGIAVDDPASNDIFELLNMHHNSGNGIFIGTKQGGGHQIINCDAHDNYDPSPNGKSPGENADGFGVHYQVKGDSTIIRGCRAWWNSDDGYDFINQEIPVTIENSYAYGSGYINSGTGQAGNGNCFKIGSSKTGIRHLVQNNVAWGCRASGFYANHSSGGNTWYNNTAYKNGTQFNMLASTWSAPNGGGTRTDGVSLTGPKAHILRNNIGFPNDNQYIGASYGTDSQFNTWDLNITPADKDFLSVAVPTPGSGILGPRQADGSPPNVDFLKLGAGSAMIDKGTDVKLPFVGAAPDLGAYEYGATGGTPTGGVMATGGVTGAAGATGGAGATAAGGKTGSGGATTGTGGETGSGGTTTVTGGKTASSSAPGTGGATGAGGGTVLGGAPGTGGNMGAGGVTETGGTSGVVDTGGTPVPGGAETGGSIVTGGQIATGGVPGSAGATGPLETGGAVVTGGTSQPGNPGGTTATTEATGTSGGCSCRIAGHQAAGSTGFALLGLLVFALRLRKRR
jgi:MYXO-CTERM domain-containing protein